MNLNFMGVTLTIGGGGISWCRLPDFNKLDDEPQHPLGCRLEILKRGKLKLYRYTQFPDRDMKFGWLLEIPEATFKLGARDNAFL